MVALANAEVAKPVGIAVGEFVGLRIGKTLLAEDQPGPVADAFGLVGQQMSNSALF
jgi:hypothetical protein